MLVEQFPSIRIQHLILVVTIIRGEDIVALEIEDADIDHHHTGNEELQTEQQCAQLATFRRESEGTFQDKCRLETGDIESRIDTRHHADDDRSQPNAKYQPQMVAQGNAAYEELADEGPLGKQITSHDRQKERQQRNTNSLTYDVQTKRRHGTAQHASGIDALDAHGTLGQCEIEEIDGSNHQDQQTR